MICLTLCWLLDVEEVEKQVEKEVEVEKEMEVEKGVEDFIVLMSSLLFYNAENSKNKEKPLNVYSRFVKTFDVYCRCF